MKRLSSSVLLVLVALMLGCAPKALERARTEARYGNLDDAISYYEEVLEEDPDNTEARVALPQVKTRASQLHQKAGLEAREAGNLEKALLELELAVRLDPANERAERDLREVEEALADRRRAERAESTATEQALERAREQEPQLPRLDPQVTGTISLDFRESGVREIYRTLGEIGGVSVLFDSAIQDEVTTFRADEVDFEQALSMLTTALGHFAKVLSPRTILVLPDDTTTRRQYADQVMRTFYLSNAEAGNIANMLRNLLRSQAVMENTELNTVTIRDTPEVVRVAERIVSANDKPGGEVLLDVEVLEVNRSALTEFGTNFLPSLGGQVSVAQDEAGISLEDLGNLSNEDLFVTLPSIRYQLFKSRSDFKLIAQPQLRVTEGQPTSLLIGQRVPIITTTFNPQTTSGGDVIPISSTEYRDVGIVLSAQPRVHHNDEVTLELEIEVSAIAGTSAIQNLPIFSSRQITATVRLRDGETNLLAGLLRDDERVAKEGVPGLMAVPVLGNLFSQTRQEVEQTDVVMSITPHILRGSQIADEDLETLYVGTEANIGGPGFGGGVQAASRARQGRPAAAGTTEPQQEPAVLALLPERHDVDVGDQIALDVTVDGATDLNSVGMQVRFDPSMLEFVDAFESGLLRQGGVETSFQASQSGNGVQVGMARIGAQQTTGVRGSGSLLTLVFRAVGSGEGEIRVDQAALRDAQGRPLPVEMRGAAVVVREER